MSINITNLGGTVNYRDNHKEVTINGSVPDVSSFVRSFFAEDVEPVQEEKTAKGLFCRITKAAFEKGVAQQVDDDLRSASVSAPKLCKTVKLNEALGYLDTKDMQSTDLYELLNEHYHLPFKVRTFQDNRGK